MEIILTVGVSLYFLIRIYLRFANRDFIKNGSVSRKRRFVFFAIDLCIILATILQLRFQEIGQMPQGGYRSVVQFFGVCLFITGTPLSSWSRLTLGRNWRPASHYRSDQHQDLITSGPYALLRHPIYAGMMLMGFGFELALANWLFLGIIPLVFFLYRQAILEEKMLENNFPQYKSYRAKTKMFLPKIF